MSFEEPIYKPVGLAHQNFTTEDLVKRKLDPGQLRSIPRLYDLGLRKPFLAMCMEMKKKKKVIGHKEGKHDAVTLGRILNWHSFTKR